MAHLQHPLPPTPSAPPTSSRPSKRTPVPLILSSFPAPPSHIPPTPSSAGSNPPPTGPPTTPLPPLPSGASRISEHEQLILLSSLANRARRSSKLSQRDSIYANRDSIVSLTTRPSLSLSRSNSITLSPTCHLARSSLSPKPLLSDISDSDEQTSPAGSPRLMRRRHHRPHQANESISSIDMRDVLGVYADEPDDDQQQQQQRPLQSTPARHLANKSIADPIDPQLLLEQPTTLPPFHARHIHTRSPSALDPLSPSSRSSSSSSASTSLSISTSTTSANPEQQQKIPDPSYSTQFSTNSIVSAELDASLSQIGLGGIVVTKMTTSTMSEMTLEELGVIRVPSPDIATILSATPRPALSRSTDARSKSRSKSRAPAGKRRVVSASTPNATAHTRNRRQSEGAPPPAHAKYPSSSELAYLHNKPPGALASDVGQGEEEYDEALEKVLEGNGSEDEDASPWVGDKQRPQQQRGRRRRDKEEDGDSDSSLDLHTPLPHLMLRHGLLSPNSKLLPHAEGSRAATPAAADGRPDSILSVVSNGSVMTKSGIIKDERDTVTRRVRHRDGKLLRGGIGLTTGLGWSDSEDEDAPSPLTRRLSSLNLSRRSSASSIRSAHLPTSPPPPPSLSTLVSASSSLRRLHPLSRSYSSGAVLESERSYSYSYSYDQEEEEMEDGEEDHSVEESGQWARHYRLGGTGTVSSPPPPPVSWQRRAQHTHTHQTGPLGSRTSTSSVGSTFSLEVTIPEDGNGNGNGNERSKTPSRLRRPSTIGSGNNKRNGSGNGRDSSGSSSLDSQQPTNNTTNNNNTHSNTNSNNTPSSTASTLSIPMPATPKDIFDPGAPPLFSSTRGMKEKSLPPLPTGGLKKKTSTGAGGTGTGKYAFPPSGARVRTVSATSNTSSTPLAGVNSSPQIGNGKPHVRPLQLPRHRERIGVGDRQAVPVPSPILSSPPIPCALSLSLSPSTAQSLLGGSVGSAGSPTTTSPSTSTTSQSQSPTSPGFERPRPRTGTGMVYRTSSYGAGGGVSRMRAPMMLSAGAAAPAASSAGASSGVPRAIAL